MAAAREIERTSIDAEVREGTARDAIFNGIGANATHGQRRTQADKRRAIERLLTDAEWAQMSDRKIGKVAKVDHKTVAKVRRELTGGIPTPAKSNGLAGAGEIPTPSQSPAKANNARNSIVDDVLRTISDDALMAECRRRELIDA